MAALPLSGLSVGAKKALLPFFKGLRHCPFSFQASLRVWACDIGQQQRWFYGLIVQAATIVASKIRYLEKTIFVMPYIWVYIKYVLFSWIVNSNDEM